MSREGILEIDTLKAAIQEDTFLISVMAVNNEIHTIQPIAEIGKICKERGILFHVDAAQAVGKIPIDTQEMNIDLLSLSAHKFYGPKGVGALFVRRIKDYGDKKRVIRIAPQLLGGSHERNFRAGTLNVPGIVGLGKAAEICEKELKDGEEIKRITRLRDKLKNKLVEKLEAVTVNGDETLRLPGGLNLSFAYVEGESLILKLKNIACSTGSACTDPSLKPSYVLQAIKIDQLIAHSSLRFCIGRFNTEEEIDYTVDSVVKAVKELRELSPLYEMAKNGVDLNTVDWGDDHDH